MEDVKSWPKRVVIIDHGKIIFDGKLKDIIDKYAEHKILTLEFSEEFPREKLEKFGEIDSWEYPRAVIKVPRQLASKERQNCWKLCPLLILILKNRR